MTVKTELLAGQQLDRFVDVCYEGGDRGCGVVDGQGRRFVALLIDPSTGEIEAYGPIDELNALVVAEELRVALAADAELTEVGVLILPLRPTAARRVAAGEAPTTG